MTSPGLADHLERRYEQQIRDVVTHLRYLADEIERNHQNPPKSMEDLKPDYWRSGRNVLHAVTWGVANLHLDSVVEAAHEAHIAVREESA